MLAVGRALPAPAGATIEWMEGDAATLPLPDAAFAVVVCQQGLQYVPDKPAALAEARRVLVPGGRAIFAVWQSIESNPVVNALNEAVRRRIGVGPLAGPFTQGDPEGLREQLTTAGFTELSVTPRELVVVFPSRAQYVRRAIESMAQMLPELAAMNVAERAELARGIEEEVAANLGPFAWGDGIAAPMAANLAAGRA